MTIPAYPVVHVNLRADGSAHLNVAGRHQEYPAGPIDDTREQIIAYAAEFAASLGRGVRMTTVDPDGEWKLAVYPDGRVEELAPVPLKRARSAPTLSAPTVVLDPIPAPSQPPAPPARSDPPDPPAPPPAPAAGWEPPAMMTTLAVLRFTTGDLAHVRSRAIIGRKPQEAQSTDGWQLVEVIDTSKTMSRVHGHVVWEAGRLLYTDRGADNGTAIVRDSTSRQLAPGESVALQHGDSLELGPIVRCEVTFHTEDPSA